MNIHFEVLGQSAPQGSKRHIGRGVLIESSKRTKPWREAIVGTLIREELAGLMIADPVLVRAHFHFARPKAHLTTKGLLRPSAPTWPTSRALGDADKHARALLDALGSDAGAGLIGDDSQVVGLIVQKRYCRPGVQPHAEVWVSPMPEIPRPPEEARG